MENIKVSNTMLGIVTIYNPDIKQTADNIRLYIDYIDKLIIWNNSTLESDIKNQMMALLASFSDKIHWVETGENRLIAKGLNYAWKYAQENFYTFILIMDQDSQWTNFCTYRSTVEKYYDEGNKWVFTPYICGNDLWPIKERIKFRRIFINSGTIIPTEIMSSIGGADEVFAIDALDHDLSYRILRKGYQIACITSCILYHTIGAPKRSKILHLFTNNYGLFRTYSITRSHIICYRKHKSFMTAYEKRKFFKEIFMWKLIRIILVEEEKIGRLKMFCKGIRDGISYKFNEENN
jgi:rhamnosyltransferase